MRQILFSGPDFTWIDIPSPTPEELDAAALEFNLHPLFVEDVLDPSHLPKIERTGNLTFLILRIFDKNSDLSATSIQGLTRKIAFFISPKFVITVHRLDPAYVKGIFDQCVHDMEGEPTPSAVLVNFLIHAIRTYYIPLGIAEEEMDSMETALFEQSTEPNFLQELHVARRRLALMKRLLIHTQDVVQRFTPTVDLATPLYQDLKENVFNLVFFNDELLEDLTNLMNLQISIASQRTNEVVRVLTLFSVFFMPLTFIVGVYGMNFRFMPELEMEHGYFGVWLLMIGVSLVIAYWFYRRGWWK